MLDLIGITAAEDGKIYETFSTSNPKIKQVNFIYSHNNEKVLDDFLKNMIFQYARSNKIID